MRLGLDDGLLDRRFVQQHFAAVGLGHTLVHARGHGRVALRIEIDQQHSTLGGGQRGSKVHSGSGLADAALLVGDSDDASHGVVDTVRE